MYRTVIIVDMLRGFLEQGNTLYCGDKARNIIPNVQKLLADEQAEGANFIYLCDAHDKDDLEFTMFPPHCIKGTVECEIIPELNKFPGFTINKTRYSGFYGTILEEILKELNPTNITVVGVCTDICVLHTIADLRNRDYKVTVPANCVASFDLEAHKFALKHIKTILGARIV